jgi:GT2 family glycosyltransferase
LIYRQTNLVQSRWFSSFNYFLSTPIPNKKNIEIEMFSGNGIFWPTYVFQNNLFNEKIPFVYEDLYFTYNLFKKWFPIICSNSLQINHMEREKTKLELLFVWTPKISYQKWKNRFILVNDLWSFFQKILFYLLWFWTHTLWLIVNVLLYGRWLSRSKIIFSLLKGTWYWLKWF